ncbi:MAG: hydrogenase maturation protease [Candidatus Njordarchaeales archaeon]
MKTLIVGRGNPIVSNDNAGILAVRILKSNLSGNLPKDIEFIESTDGNLSFAEQLVGYNEVYIIDTIRDPRIPHGEIKIIENILDIHSENIPINIHDIDLLTAIHIIKNAIPEEFPKKISLFGINVLEAFSFSEHMGNEIMKSVKKIVKIIEKRLFGEIQ